MFTSLAQKIEDSSNQLQTQPKQSVASKLTTRAASSSLKMFASIFWHGTAVLHGAAAIRASIISPSKKQAYAKSSANAYWRCWGCLIHSFSEQCAPIPQTPSPAPPQVLPRREPLPARQIPTLIQSRAPSPVPSFLSQGSDSDSEASYTSDHSRPETPIQNVEIPHLNLLRLGGEEGWFDPLSERPILPIDFENFSDDEPASPKTPHNADVVIASSRSVISHTSDISGVSSNSQFPHISEISGVDLQVISLPHDENSPSDSDWEKISAQSQEEKKK